MNKSYIDKNTISIDWKCPIEDTYEWMLEQWTKWKHILSADSFTSLVENYNSELADVYLPAIGQELSMYDLFLYLIYTDTDEINIILIEQEKQKEFETISKSLGLKVTLQKQPRKKIGSPATRLNLESKLTYEEFEIEDEIVFFNLPYTVAIKLGKGENRHRDRIHKIYDFSQFPPIDFSTLNISELVFNQSLGLWATLLWDDKGEYSKVIVGKDIHDMVNWTTFDFADVKFKTLSNLQWHENNIFVSRESEAWLIEFHELQKSVCKKIIQLDAASSTSYCKLIKTKNKNYFIFSEYNIFALKKNKVSNTELKTPKVISHSYIPLLEDKVYYISNNKLHEFDLVTGSLKCRELNKVSTKHTLSHLIDNWAIITCLGNTQNELDIAQLWNYETDSWYRIKLGALGTNGVSDAKVKPNGDVIFEYHNKFFYLKNFICDIVPTLEKFEPMPWENVMQSKQKGKNHFLDSLKRIFRKRDI